MAVVRFDRDARYGAAIVGVLFAGYLNIAVDFSAFIQAAAYDGSIPTDVPLVNVVEFLTILGLYIGAFCLIPATAVQRAGAITLVSLLLVGWAFLGVEFGVGDEALRSSAWSFLLHQGFVTLVAAVGGWIIVRGYHPLSWVVMVIAFAPPITAVVLDQASTPAVAYTLIIQAVVVIGGIGAAVLAWWIDRQMRARTVRRTATAASGIAPGLRFTDNARYGAALVGMLFAGYLNLATDFTNYLLQTTIAAGTDVTPLSVIQLLTILGLYVASLLMMPVNGYRRLAAITLTSVVLLLWTALGIERAAGNLINPVTLWFFLLNQGFVTVLAGLGGWVIVRGRHPISWIVLALAFVPPLVAQALVNASVTSGAYTLVMEGVVVIVGIGGAWIAWLIDSLVRRERRS